MNLTPLAEKRLLRLYEGPINAAGRSHAPGYGGLTRPIEPAEPYAELLGKGLIHLTEEWALRPPGDYMSKRRCQWVWKATDLGIVTAKLLGVDEQR